MTARITAHETAILAALGALSWLRLKDNSAPDTARVRGVADYQTAISFEGVTPPAALLQYSGSRRAPSPNKTDVIGLPTRDNMTFSWSLYVLSESFSGMGEGRLGGNVSSDPGSYQEIDDVYAALSGLSVDPQITDKDGRLRYVGDDYLQAQDGRIVYVSRWTHWARRIGAISV